MAYNTSDDQLVAHELPRQQVMLYVINKLFNPLHNFPYDNSVLNIYRSEVDIKNAVRLDLLQLNTNGVWKYDLLNPVPSVFVNDFVFHVEDVVHLLRDNFASDVLLVHMDRVLHSHSVNDCHILD